MSLKNANFLELLGTGVTNEDKRQDFVICVRNTSMETQGVIRAHKLLLGLVSPKFQLIFENLKVERINVDGHSMRAWEIVMKYIYSGDSKLITSLSVTDLLIILEIYDISKEFCLKEIDGLAKTTLDSLINAGNYAAILSAVVGTSGLKHLEDLHKEMMLRCALEVRKEWSSVEDCLRFMTSGKENKADKDAKAAIIDIMATICFRCSNYKTCCPMSVKLTKKNCTVGCLVKAEADITSSQGVVVRDGTVGRIVEHHKKSVRIFCKNRKVAMTGVIAVRWEGIQYPLIHETRNKIVTRHSV